ncbi:hypothetical protein ES703_101233 [subsurface metagenome]
MVLEPRKQLRPVPPNPLKPIADDLTKLKFAADSLAENLEKLTDEIFRTGKVPPGIAHGILRDFFPSGKIEIFGQSIPLPEEAVGLAPISELLRNIQQTRQQIDKALEQAREAILRAAGGS